MGSEVALSPSRYVALIRKSFADAGDPVRAGGQARYMRQRYAFAGLKAPEWLAIVKDMFRENGVFDGDDLKAFARLCFEEEYHEMFYAALQMMEKQLKKQPAGFIDFLEEAVIAGDWWDTVDWLATLTGKHLSRFPALQHRYARKWIATDNIWLQRVAIIHQLKYKEKTDEDLLFEMILTRKSSQEFFVQKGAGWALREYSKSRPKAVRRFISAHPELPALTRREGLKWLQRQ